MNKKIECPHCKIIKENPCHATLRDDIVPLERFIKLSAPDAPQELYDAFDKLVRKLEIPNEVQGLFAVILPFTIPYICGAPYKKENFIFIFTPNEHIDAIRKAFFIHTVIDKDINRNLSAVDPLSLDGQSVVASFLTDSYEINHLNLCVFYQPMNIFNADTFKKMIKVLEQKNVPIIIIGEIPPTDEDAQG